MARHKKGDINMREIDENIAKIKMQKRMINEQKKAMESDNSNKDDNKKHIDELIKQIKAGRATINETNFIFENKVYLDGKIEMPIPLAYFEEATNTKEVVSLVNENGISLNVSYIEKNSKKVEFPEFKIVFEKNMKNMGFSLKWIEEGKIVNNNETLFYGTYEIPTARGIIFNLIFYKVKNLKSLIGTYNCFKRDYDTWGSIIKASVNLVKVKL